MNHTPGPWNLDDAAHVRDGGVIHDDYHIISAPYRGESEGFRVSGFMSKADAALLASAPDLLAERDALRAVLREILTQYNSGWIEPKTIRSAEKLLGQKP